MKMTQTFRQVDQEGAVVPGSKVIKITIDVCEDDNNMCGIYCKNMVGHENLCTLLSPCEVPLNDDLEHERTDDCLQIFGGMQEDKNKEDQKTIHDWIIANPEAYEAVKGILKGLPFPGGVG